MVVKNKLKKVLGVVVVAGTLCIATVGGVMADWTTASYSFTLEFNTLYPYKYSDIQRKDNDSSAYVYCDENMHYNFSACIVGYDGSLREDIMLTEQTLYPGMDTTITNWVYENGIPFARLRGISNVDTVYEAFGYWSANTY